MPLEYFIFYSTTTYWCPYQPPKIPSQLGSGHKAASKASAKLSTGLQITMKHIVITMSILYCTHSLVWLHRGLIQWGQCVLVSLVTWTASIFSVFNVFLWWRNDTWAPSEKGRYWLLYRAHKTHTHAHARMQPVDINTLICYTLS